MATVDNLGAALLIGSGATALVDLWAIVRRRLFGTAPPNYAYVGRWFAHMLRGRFRHDSIAASGSVRGELAIGWVAHYVIGILFATLLLAIVGPQWQREPTFFPALVVGVATVVAPFLILQPGMGAGVASSRSARPIVARAQSIITHAIFGVGLYVAAFGATLLDLVPKSH